ARTVMARTAGAGAAVARPAGARTRVGLAAQLAVDVGDVAAAVADVQLGPAPLAGLGAADRAQHAVPGLGVAAAALIAAVRDALGLRFGGRRNGGQGGGGQRGGAEAEHRGPDGIEGGGERAGHDWLLLVGWDLNAPDVRKV